MKSDIKSADGDSVVRNILSARKYKGYKGSLLSKAELENQLANGCSWCELEFISIDDKFAWLEDEKPVCSKCLSGEHHEPLQYNSTVLN